MLSIVPSHMTRSITTRCWAPAGRETQRPGAFYSRLPAAMLCEDVRFGEVDWEVALPTITFTQGFVKRRGDKHAPTLDHRSRIQWRWQLFRRQLGQGLWVLLALFHAQVQSAVLVHFYGHVLDKMSGLVPGTGPRSQLNKLGDNDLCCVDSLLEVWRL